MQEAEEARARQEAEAAQNSGEASGPNGEKPQTMPQGAGDQPSGGESDPSVNIQPIPYVFFLLTFY